MVRANVEGGAGVKLEDPRLNLAYISLRDGERCSAGRFRGERPSQTTTGRKRAAFLVLGHLSASEVVDCSWDLWIVCSEVEVLNRLRWRWRVSMQELRVSHWTDIDTRRTWLVNRPPWVPKAWRLGWGV